jgi:hypothetical protein
VAIHWILFWVMLHDGPNHFLLKTGTKSLVIQFGSYGRDCEVPHLPNADRERDMQ